MIKNLVSKKVLLVVAAIAIILVLVTNFASAGGNSPTGVVKNLINHSENSEWEKGEELISSEMKSFLETEGASENMRLAMAQLVNEEGSGTLDGYKITHEDIMEEQGQGTVYVDFSFDNELVTKSWEFNVVKEDGKWKVNTFRPA